MITCGVSFMAWLGDKQGIGRRSGVGKIRAACPFMSVSGRDEREDWTRDLVFLKTRTACLFLSLFVVDEKEGDPRQSVLCPSSSHSFAFTGIQRYCCQECSSESISSLN